MSHQRSAPALDLAIGHVGGLGTTLAVRHPRRTNRGVQARSRTMGTLGDRGEGLAKEAGGKIKQTVGKVAGSDQIQAEGKAKELQGEAQQEVGKASERANST